MLNILERFDGLQNHVYGSFALTRVGNSTLLLTYPFRPLLSTGVVGGSLDQKGRVEAQMPQTTGVVEGSGGRRASESLPGSGLPVEGHTPMSSGWWKGEKPRNGKNRIDHRFRL